MSDSIFSPPPKGKPRNRSNAPQSPTDNMLSPCSQRIRKMKNKKLKKVDEIFTSKRNRIEISNNNSSPTTLPIILGSSSSFRKSILESYNWTFSTISPDIDEKSIRTNNPMELPLKIAIEKAKALEKVLSTRNEETILITSDQVSLFSGVVREKPENEEQAIEYLSSYSNNQVMTVCAVVVTHYPSLRQAIGVDTATVKWKEITPEIISRVVARKEVFNSCGGFIIEDEDLKECILEIEGTSDSVRGLPMHTLIKAIKEVIET